MSSDQTRPQGSSPSAPPLVAKKLEEPKQTNTAPREPTTAEDQKKESKPTKDKHEPSDIASTKRSASRSRSRDKEKGRRERQGATQQSRQSDRNGDRHDRDRSKVKAKSVKRRQFSSRQQEQNKNTTYFKTKMCPAFLNGRCIKEGRCTFAHGAHELREMPNFKKTKLCNEYLRGECPFSSRECKYAHGESELKRHATNQQHRAEYEAEMKKYQVNSYDYAPPPPAAHYGSMPPPTYHHGMRGSSHGSSSGYPPPPTGHYPPLGHGSSHVQPFMTQLPHHYDRPGYGNAPPSGNWSGYPGGSWIPPTRSQPGPYGGPLSSSFSGFDPITSPLPYRHLDFGAPGNNVNVSRSGQVPLRDIVAPPPNSNFGSGGMSSNFSTSGTFTTPSGPFSGSSSSNLYSANVGSYTSGNPPNSSATTSSGPFLSYLPGNNGNSFDTFQMSLNESMPRRMPLPPS